MGDEFWKQTSQALQTALASDPTLSSRELAIRFIVALLLGGAVGLIFRLSHGGGRDDSLPFLMTLVLLPALIAMVSVVIGNSVARAFSLMGALSIVRFRTVVEDTRDTAFVIFSVVVGMAAGAGLILVAVIGIPCVGLAAIALNKWPQIAGFQRGRIFLITAKLNLSEDARQNFEKALQEHGIVPRLNSGGTARQGTALELSYDASIPKTVEIPTLILKLNQVSGVQGVEIKDA
jgi:uncharacterized membrane protein YhiD involved in acid resistance